MNKKIIVGITIAIVVIGVTAVGLKTILGDKATEVPGEERAENALNIQETSNATVNSTGPVKSDSVESSESGP